MEVCLDFETSIPVCSHRNLFLHLLCPALNTERSVHWAFEKSENKKPLSWKSKGSRTTPQHKACSQIAGAGSKAESQKLQLFQLLRSLSCPGVEKSPGKIRSYLVSVIEPVTYIGNMILTCIFFFFAFKPWTKNSSSNRI